MSWLNTKCTFFSEDQASGQFLLSRKHLWNDNRPKMAPIIKRKKLQSQKSSKLFPKRGTMPSRQSLLFNKCPLNLTSQSPDPRTPLRHLELNTGGELAYPISVLTALSVCRNGTAFQALDFIKTITFKFLELADE